MVALQIQIGGNEMTECSQKELAQIVGGGVSRPNVIPGQSDKIEIGRPGFVKRPPLARI